MADDDVTRLEQRVQRLERFRYRMLGMINVQNTIIADLVCEQLFTEDYPSQALEALKQNWLVRTEQPTQALRSIDPAEGDLIAQEFREAVDLLATTIAARLRLHRPRGQ
jgi:hypothetical protein